MYLDSTVEKNPCLPKYLADHLDILDDAYFKGNHQLFARTLDRMKHLLTMYYTCGALNGTDYYDVLKRYGITEQAQMRK